MRNVALKYIQMVLLLLMGSQVSAQEENRLRLPDITGMESSTISLPVYLDNTTTDITGLQFDVTVPKEVLTITTGATTLSDRKVDHEVIVNAIGGNTGTYRVMVYSPSNTPLSANSGEVLTLSVKVANVVDKDKTYPLQLSRVSIGDKQGNNVLTGTADGTFRCLACPDFTVSDIRWTTSNVAPGDTLQLSWKVSNVGGAPATGGWSERITMVDESGAERYLGTCYNSEAILAMGATASRSAKVVIPQLPGLEGKADIRIEVVPNSDSGEGVAYRANNTLQTTSHGIQLSKCLSLTMPKATVIEGKDATLHCKISRSGHTDIQQTVTLTMLFGDNRLTLPPTMDMPQGQSAAWFDITLSDNNALDDDSLFVIQATVNGYDAVRQDLLMIDDELRQLTMTVSKSAPTEGDTFTLTVKTEKAMSQPITVKLTAEHPERLLMAETVTIAANATTAETVVAVVDNEVIDLPTSLAIKGVADKHHPGECLIMVEDNDMPAIDLELSASTVSENAISPAAVATLRRTTHTDREATILLSCSSDDIVLSTKKITMKEGETEKLFTINVKDNDQVDGTRQAAITAAVRVASCNCSADTTTVGSVTKTLEITDDDGASLNITSSRASIVKGSGKTVTLTISRNTSTKKKLTVTLSSDNDAVVTYPHSVTIPANAASAEVTVTATEDATTDAKTVAFTAEAANHAKGSCWLTLADTPYPIAEVKDVTFSSTEVTSGGEVEVTITVANVGTASLPENTKIEYYIDGKKQPYSISIDQAIEPGGEITITETIFLPETVGSYEITFKVEDYEGTGGSATWTIGNSLSEPATLSTTSPFTATITTDKQVYKQEDVVTFSGQLQGEKTTYTDVQITLRNDGARQLLIATTDGEGRFSTTYQLRSLQTGHFTVSAGSPGENVTEEMAGFDVYGLTVEAPKNVEMVLPETYAGSIKISNPGNKVQTNVRVEMLSESSTCDFSFNSLGNIDAGATVDLPFTITSKALTEENGWQKMFIAIITDEGAIVRRTIQYYVQCKTGKLKPSTAYIDATMNIHTAKEYPVVVRNIGKGETGKITLALPSWITTATPREIASIAPGDSTTMLLKFNPTSDMQLNVAVTGNIGLQCANGEGATIPFRLTLVSELKGKLTLDVVDELTFYTEEAPHVSNATVKVIHPSTKQVLASGTTDDNGIFSAEIEEGWYNVRVEAENHDPYTNNFVINPGRERKEQVFIKYADISYSLEVEEIEIEDEYKVDVTLVSETSAPVPVVDIWWDKQWHEPGDIFPVVATNKGFFSAYDIEVTMTPQPGTKFIFLDDPHCEELKGKTAVEYLVKVIEDDENGAENAPRKAGTNNTNNEYSGPTPSSTECVVWGAGVTYNIVCCKKKVPHYSISCRYMGHCNGNDFKTGRGNSGSRIYNLQSQKVECDEEEPEEEVECDEDPNLIFQLLSVKFNDRLRGMAADGKTQVRIALDKNATKPKKECNYTYHWELSTTEKVITNDPALNKIKTQNANTLDKFTITAPEDYPWPDEKAKEHDIYAILKYKKEDGEEQQTSVKVTISRVPVVFVHGLASNPSSCWSSMVNYLTKSNCYDGRLLFTVDYEKTNTNSFSTNQLIVFNTVIDVLNTMSMKYDIETAKVDIVAHSMGGLLTRQDISKGLKDYIHKFITINTPHGGSQLGNFLTDENTIWVYKTSHFYDYNNPPLFDWAGKGILNILYSHFSPKGINETPDVAILHGAVNDLKVGGSAIAKINSLKTNVKCHAIATVSYGDSDLLLSLGFIPLSFLFDYDNTHALFNDLFHDANDCIVPSKSQKGGLGGSSLTFRTGDGSFAHTSSCHNKTIQGDVLDLLKEKTSSAKFTNGFNVVTGLEYKMTHLDEWIKKQKEKLSSQKLNSEKIKVRQTYENFKLTYSQNFGDTLINVNVIHDANVSDIKVVCLYQDKFISYIDGDNGIIILPKKTIDDVVLLYYGRDNDGSWIGGSDTISINTIGSSTISQLSFTSDSLLIINDEYVSPHVKCTWSDGVVTDLEDAILSVVDEDMAYVDNNRWVYGRKAGRTELRATYQGHSCSIPLNVFVCKRDRNEDDDDDHSDANEVCSVVTLQISQEAVMTRQAFRATFTLNNGHQTSSLKDFKLNIEIQDQEGNLVTPHEFQVNLDSLVNFQGAKMLNNAWTLLPKESGKAIMILIPTKYAAPTLPVTYSIGGSFSYTDPYSGLLVTREIAPVDILVKPTPDLDLTYFMQRDVFGDDPLTDNVVEPMKQAEFALVIHNKGNGDAKNVSFATAQPEIVENEKGLVVDFSIVSSQLNGADATLALGGTVVTDFGSIPAHSKTYAQWWLESTLLGHFIEYNVEATHVTSYDNEDLSLLGDVTIHELAHGFTPDPLAETPVRAFLVNDIPDDADTPDTLYFTDDREEESVSVASNVVMTRITDTEYEVTVTPSTRGWTYGKVNDLTAGKQQIVLVVRKSDGKHLPVDNFWQTDRTLRDGKKPRYENMLHFIVETNMEETYILSFSPKPAVELEVVSIAGPPPEGEVLTSQLSSVTVTFNKAIDATTFTTDDLTLNCQGKQVSLTPVGIVQNSETEYLIQFGEATLDGGYYVFTVKTENITDTEGFTGYEGKMASWTQYPDGKVMLTVKASPAEGGTVTPSNGKVGRDSEVTLKAVPSAGYMFYRWLHYDDPLEETETFNYTLTRDEEFTAEFIPIIFEEPENDADREMYVVLSPDSTTLTFYYDKNRAKWENARLIGSNGWRVGRTTVTRVVFNSSFAKTRPTDTSYWFSNMEKLEDITGLEYLNTSNVMTMRQMFAGCSCLTSLDLSHFDTSNVTNMDFMFYYCHNLKRLDLSHFDTSNVAKMKCLFMGCDSLEELDVSSFDTSKVTDMTSLFSGCYSLKKLDVSNFNTSNVTNMINMFMSCKSLENLDLSNFDTSNVTNMDIMFGFCEKLKNIDVTSFNTSNVTNMGSMFSGCNALTSLDLSHFDTSNVEMMVSMFYNCSSLTRLDLRNFNTSNVNYMMNMFASCSSLINLDVSHFDTSKVSDMRWMFCKCSNLTSLNLRNFVLSDDTETYSMLSGCSSLIELSVSPTMENIDAGCCLDVGTASSPCTIIAPDGFNFGVDTSGNYFQWKSGYFKLLKGEPYAVLSPDNTTLTFYYDDLKATREGTAYGLNTGYSYPGWFGAAKSVQHVVFNPIFAVARPVSTRTWFCNMSSLMDIEGLQYLNTSNVTTMGAMFDSCKSLTSLDLSSFDTGNVTNMAGMFSDCGSLTFLNLSSFDTGNVTDMAGMFSDCGSLTSLNIGSFNTSKVANMETMFYGCKSLTSLDLSHFDTSNVTSMEMMFDGCRGLTNLDVSHFNTGKVTTMLQMFFDCNNLTNLDVSNFDTSNMINMERMFDGCKELTNIDVSHFNTSKVIHMGYMFYGCSKLTSLDLSGFDLTQVQYPVSGLDLFPSCISLKALKIPSGMEILGDYSCWGVGTASSPCTIIAPEGFDFGVDTSGKYFLWKSGYFKLGSAFLPGDVNHDGAVNITDVMSVVNYIMGTTPAVFFIENADMNGDGSINITDVTVIVNIILHGSAAMVPENVREQLMDELVVAPDADGYVISLKNHEPYTALQMDVVLPEGTELIAVKLENNRSDNHKTYHERVSGNHYRVVVYSQEGSEIKGSEGELLQLLTYGARRGSATVSDVMLTNKQLETVLLPGVVNSIGSPAIDDDDETPSFTIQGIPAERHKRGVVVRKGSKRAVK